MRRQSCFMLVRVSLLAAVVALASCKTAATAPAADLRSAEPTEAPPAAEPVDDAAAASFIAESVGRLAELPRFYINAGKGDQPNDAVVPTIVDEAAKTIRFDFTPFAAAFPEAGAAAKLSELMTFALPDGVPADAQKNLSDPIFAMKFLKSLAKSYGDMSGANHAFDVDEEEYVTAFEACKEQQFSKTATIVSSVTSGADFEVPWDCSKLKRQTKSKLTLTALEVSVLASYTGEFYTTTARLLRARKFKLPTQNVAAAPSAKRMAIEGFLSLAIVSAINKVDETPAKTYRGVGGFYAACEPGQAALVAAQTPVEAAAAFCEYFKTHDTYRECAFASTSRLGNIALTFNGVFDDVQGQQFGQDGPTYYRSELPKTGKVGLVEEIDARNGLDVAAFSAMPYELEVLYKPGSRYKVKPNSAVIAIRKSQTAPADYPNFQLVPCGTALTPTQQKTISHFRIGLVQ